MTTTNMFRSFFARHGSKASTRKGSILFWSTCCAWNYSSSRSKIHLNRSKWPWCAVNEQIESWDGLPGLPMLVDDGAMPVIMHNQNHLLPIPHFKFTFTNRHHTPNPKGLRPIFLLQFTLTVSGRGLPLPNRGFHCAFLRTKLTDAFTAVSVNGAVQKTVYSRLHDWLPSHTGCDTHPLGQGYVKVKD